MYVVSAVTGFLQSYDPTAAALWTAATADEPPEALPRLWFTELGKSSQAKSDAFAASMKVGVTS